MAAPQSAGALSRRGLLGTAGLLLLAPAPVLAGPRRLAFEIRRNGDHVGEHLMTISGDASAPTAISDVSMLVKLGPVPVYRYSHHAVERWTQGRFLAIETSTDANGKTQTVHARRGESGLVIETAKGRMTGPANSSPLTHWNPAAFAGALFNPQEGRMLQVKASRVGADHWAVRGEAQIDDFYDADGAWVALRGLLKDGSVLEYRRV